MKNWSTDTSRLLNNAHEYKVWHLSQLINYGLGSEKLAEDDLRTYWDELDIDPYKKEFLNKLLWPHELTCSSLVQIC